MSEEQGFKIKAEEAKFLEEGKYEGEITDIKRRTDKYDYTDYTIKEKDSSTEMRVGFPTALSYTKEGEPNTVHAKFLKRMGLKVKIGDEVDPNSLVGTKVTFVTFLDETDRGTFSAITRESIKKLEE